MIGYVEPYTKADDDVVTQMWADGKSYGEIGAVLNRTRSSVAGRVRRLKLPKKTQAAINAMAARSAKMRWDKPDKPKRPFVFSPRTSKERKPPMLQRVYVAPDSVPVSLVERTGCCFPTTTEKPHLFCNAAVGEKQSYCEFHLNVMYPKRRAA